MRSRSRRPRHRRVRVRPLGRRVAPGCCTAWSTPAPRSSTSSAAEPPAGAPPRGAPASGHDGADGERPAGAGHRDAVVAVADRVGVADGRDGDRGQHGPALLGEPDGDPAAARRPRRPELAVELGRAVRLEAARDGVDRDVAQAAAAGAREPARPPRRRAGRTRCSSGGGGARAMRAGGRARPCRRPAGPRRRSIRWCSRRA